jgi:hypothetical protein
MKTAQKETDETTQKKSLQNHFRLPCRPFATFFAFAKRNTVRTLSLTSALDGVGGQHHAPAALLPGKTRYPLYRG